MRQLLAVTCLSLCCAAPAAAQSPTPATSKAEAKAEAKATADSSDTKSKRSSSSQRVTHRVVVVNGKTIVDEKTVDNKPVKGRLGGKPSMDAEKMLRELRELTERDMGRDWGRKLKPRTPLKPRSKLQPRTDKPSSKKTGARKTVDVKKAKGRARPIR